MPKPDKVKIHQPLFDVTSEGTFYILKKNSNIFSTRRSFVSHILQIGKSYASVTNVKLQEQQQSKTLRVIIFSSTMRTVTGTS